MPMSRWLMILPLVFALEPASQPARPDREQRDIEAEVRRRVELMLRATGELRYYALPRYFTKNANIVRVDLDGQGIGREGWVTTAEEWIASLEALPGWNRHEEQLSNVTITVESEALVVMTADFRIFRGPELRSHGFQCFTLIREGDDWKIASIAFTNFPDWAH